MASFNETLLDFDGLTLRLKGGKYTRTEKTGPNNRPAKPSDPNFLSDSEKFDSSDSKDDFRCEIDRVKEKSRLESTRVRFTVA